MANDEATETVERKRKSKVSTREVLGPDGKPQDEYIGAAGASYEVISEGYTASVMFEELADEGPPEEPPVLRGDDNVPPGLPIW